MNCTRARELFSDYLEGNVQHTLGTLVRGHVDECPECKREYGAFKQTWCTLGTLPDVPAPSNFRHDVLMRMARLQHERRQSVSGAVPRQTGGVLIRPLFALRAVAVACAAAALAFALLTVPRKLDNEYAGTFVPPVQSLREFPRVAEGHSLQAARKQEWKSRRVGRNTVWASITPDRNGNRATLYRVMLSINHDALLEGEITARIGARVYLLPPDVFGPADAKAGHQVWDGSILKGSPVIVPVIVDESENRSGSVNLLVTWTFRQRKFAYLIFLPPSQSRDASRGSLNLPVSGSGLNVTDSSLYSALQTIAQDHGTPIIANAYLEEKPSVTDLGERSLDGTLRDTLDPLGLDWLYADGAVYVDWKYEKP